MNRAQLHVRLLELGTAIATGGVSDAYAGAKLMENLIEGTGGGGAGGKVPNFLHYHPARVAEISRAIVERLNVQECATLEAMYWSGLHNQRLQAGRLKIQVPALKARRRKIFIKLLDWFSPGGRALRAIAADAHTEIARQRRIADRDVDLDRLKAKQAEARKRAQANGVPEFDKRGNRSVASSDPLHRRGEVARLPKK